MNKPPVVFIAGERQHAGVDPHVDHRQRHLRRVGDGLQHVGAPHREEQADRATDERE